jgi:hypothetical protein
MGFKSLSKGCWREFVLLPLGMDEYSEFGTAFEVSATCVVNFLVDDKMN